MSTKFEDMAAILAELYVDVEGEEDWVDFLRLQSFGLALAFAYDYKIVPHTAELEKYVTETWGNFMEAIGAEDLGYTQLAELIDDDGNPWT